MFIVHKLEVLWDKVEFSKLKNVCIRERRLSDKLRSNLESASNLQELFNLLSNSPFCNWMEIRVLKCMANVADIPEATTMLNIFEECVHHRKCSEVMTHVVKQFINPDHLTKVIAKLNENAENIVVADLIRYCHKLESILQLPPESITLVGSNTGCLEVHLVIPHYCRLHAYRVSQRCFFKLRPLKIQYLQIGNFPNLYTTNLIETMEANSLLTKISSHDNCKFKRKLIGDIW